MQGRLIIFEGTDGSGKSTQARRFHAHLEGRGLAPLHIREPGSTYVGEEVRKLLISTVPEGEPDLTPETEMLLYMACRAQLFRTVIRPALQKGRWIVLERSYYSTYAYQGTGLGMDKARILEMGEWVCDGVRPHAVLLLDLPVSQGLARLRNGKDRIENRDRAFHERVRSGYLELAARDPGLFRVVDGTGDPDDVEKRIHAALQDLR